MVRSLVWQAVLSKTAAHHNIALLCKAPTSTLTAAGSDAPNFVPSNRRYYEERDAVKPPNPNLPPVFALLAYLIFPWTTWSMWLFYLELDKTVNAFPLLPEMCVLFTVFVLRALLRRPEVQKLPMDRGLRRESNENEIV